MNDHSHSRCEVDDLANATTCNNCCCCCYYTTTTTTTTTAPVATATITATPTTTTTATASVKLQLPVSMRDWRSTLKCVLSGLGSEGVGCGWDKEIQGSRNCKARETLNPKP